MLKLFKYLILGHVHKWEEVSFANGIHNDCGNTVCSVHLRCVECGKQKSVILDGHRK